MKTNRSLSSIFYLLSSLALCAYPFAPASQEEVNAGNVNQMTSKFVSPKTLAGWSGTNYGIFLAKTNGTAVGLTVTSNLTLVGSLYVNSDSGLGGYVSGQYVWSGSNYSRTLGSGYITNANSRWEIYTDSVGSNVYYSTTLNPSGTWGAFAYSPAPTVTLQNGETLNGGAARIANLIAGNVTATGAYYGDGSHLTGISTSQTNDLTKVSTNETRAIRLATVLITNPTTSATAPLLKFSPTNTTVPAYIWNVEPLVSNAFYGVFGLNLEGSTFNGLFDNVATLGWNQSAGGTRQNSGGTANWLQWEHHYKPYSGSDNRAQDEFHLSFVDLNGNTDRPFFYSMDATNLLNWYATYALDSQTFYLPSNGYGNGAIWMQQSPAVFNVQNGGTGFNFNMSSAGSVFLNPSGTNDFFIGNGTGSSSWKSFSVNTKTYGSLVMSSGGLVFTGGSGGASGITAGGFVASGAANTVQPGIEFDDTTGNSGSRNWVLRQTGSSTAQGLNSHYGQLDLSRSATPGGDYRPNLGGIYVARFDTNKINFLTAVNIQDSPVGPNTNGYGNLTVSGTGTFTNGVASYRTNAFTTSEITTNGFGHWNSNGSIYISVNVAGVITNKLIAP